MNHYQEAERLLALADELWEGPRVGVAKTLAAMASAHATLAQTKATRQGLAEDHVQQTDLGPALVGLELAVAIQAAVDSLSKWNGDNGSLVVDSNIRHLSRALVEAGGGLGLVEHDQAVYEAGRRAGRMEGPGAL